MVLEYKITLLPHKIGLNVYFPKSDSWLFCASDGRLGMGSRKHAAYAPECYGTVVP